MAAATCWLVLGRPDTKGGKPKVRGVRASKPRLAADEIAVKAIIEVPWEVWEEFIPTVSIEVGREHVRPPEPVIEATLEIQPEDAGFEVGRTLF